MFVIIIWEAKTLYFLFFHRVMLVATTANYDLAIIEDYLAGNAKIKISIKKTKWRRCHIRRALATVANRKCDPGNIISELELFMEEHVTECNQSCDFCLKLI